MKELLGETATCEVKARDQYGRAVARCFPGFKTEEDLAEAESIDGGSGKESGDAGLALVESGDAVAYRQFSKGFYEPAERKAREDRVGIWSGEFEARFFFFPSFFFRGRVEVRREKKKMKLTEPRSRSLLKQVQVPEDWRREQRIKMLQDVAARRAPSPGPLSALEPSLLPPPPPWAPPPPPAPAPSRSASPSSAGPSSSRRKGGGEGCDIKGNISANGSKRYHVPGTVFYDSVKIDESKGERWFCSEQEAETAGWSRAQYGGRPPKEKAAPSTEAEAEEAAVAAAVDDVNDGEEQAQN